MNAIPPPTNTGVIEVLEPSELELISQPWEVMIKPIDRNPFKHQKSFLMTPSIILYKESYNSAMQVQGLTPAKMFGFTIPLNLGSKSLYWNTPFTPDILPASLPGGLDVIFDAGQAHIVVLIKLAILEKMLTREQFITLKKAASRRQLPIHTQALNFFTQWLLKLLSYAQLHPDIFQRSSVLRSVEEELLQKLLTVVRLPLQRSALESRQKHRQGFELALEFLRGADLSSLSVPELCSKTGVSQRTLEYAFREHINITPVSFIKKLRLHAVRRILLSSHTGEISIADTAFQYGIYDMSRFAEIYRKHFGELPSQTLVKPLIRTDSHLLYLK